MAISTRNEGAKVNSNINVTPMVDVMLVLLIIFMVITPMLQNGVSVDLAQVNNPERMPDAEKEDAKKGHRDNHHKGGDDHFVSRGPRDLTELHPHLVQELAPALWMFFDPFPKRPRA